ncbi:MAG: AmpG family muropeptide MFS transporter [Myxococcales bacterium FL481]|nr:MAG: AmpG family muropeptide MFS transporter [Myxococcales bacterium FL481]
MTDSPEANSSPETDRRAAPPSTSPHLWVTSTYFAEGFPYTVVNGLAEIMFKEFGATLQVIGLTSLFHLPWNLKFLWGPWLDRFATKRSWLIWTEVWLSVALVGLAATVHTGAVLAFAAVAFTLIAVLSATHDIAIDGYYLEALDESGKSKFVGYRAMAFRVAGLLVSGPLLVAIGRWGWSSGLLLCAAVMGTLMVLHARLLPRVETQVRSFGDLGRGLLRRRVFLVAAAVALAFIVERETGWAEAAFRWFAATAVLARLGVGGVVGLLLVLGLLTLLGLRRWIFARLGSSNSPLAVAYTSFLAQPRVGRVLAFVILFRTGESFLLKMRWPFLRDEMGMTLETYGLVNGTVGVAASFSATLLGGWLIGRQGLKRWLWPFLLAQNLLNLSYFALAEAGMGVAPWVVTVVIVGEHFGAGLGTAVFMVYIMRCCHPDHKAAHMALVTAVMSVGFSVAGVFSGFAAEAIGFSGYFVFTFLASVPAMLLVFGVPHLDDPAAADADPGEPS